MPARPVPSGPTAYTAEPDTSITLYEDGPLIVRGTIELLTMDGDVIDPGRGTVALCRCGRSARKPFCDGTHARTMFRASGGDDRPASG